jgi:hypothetical protein
LKQGVGIRGSNCREEGKRIRSETDCVDLEGLLKLLVIHAALKPYIPKYAIAVLEAVQHAEWFEEKIVQGQNILKSSI